MPKIYNLAFFISHKCNLRCPYCFEDAGRGEEMTKAMVKNVYSFFKSCDKLSESRLEIFGGEPTLNKDLFLYALKEYFQDSEINNKLYSMTNGTCLDEDYIKEIAEITANNSNPKKDFIFHVSMDDVDAGEKNLLKIKNNLENLKKYNIKYTIQLVVNKDNYYKLYDIVATILPYVSDSLNLRRLCDMSVWTQEEIDIIEKQCKKIINNLDYKKIVFPGKYAYNGEDDKFCIQKVNSDYTILFIDVNGDLYYCEGALADKKDCLGNIFSANSTKRPPNKKLKESYTTCLLRAYNGHNVYNHMVKNIQQQLKERNLSVYFEVTDSCNYACDYCCKSWRTSLTGHMSNKILDKLININAKYYLITGGEPGLAKEKVRYFIENALTNNIRINSNLCYWNETDLLYLKSFNIGITVDIPSLNKDKYLKITGALEHNFKAVLKNLRMLDQNTTIICIVVCKENIDSYQNDILNFAAEYGFKRFSVTPAISVNKKIDAVTFFNSLNDFIYNHKNLNIVTLANIPGIGEVPYSHECTAGKDRFVVLSNGDVVPCAWNKKNIVGNILTSSMKTILENGKSYFNKFSNTDKLLCKGYVEGDKC